MACYGLWPPWIEFTYDHYVGLWLNIGRIRYQKADTIFTGMGLARAAKLPKEYFDAVSESPQEAQEAEMAVNLQRAHQEAIRKAIEGLGGHAYH